MPIAITCSGCSAAFEVPDTLAGKTIRCTSCKTQVNVPESVAASSQTGTKKPFGWAGSSSTSANANDSAPMSLDDDAPMALDDDETPQPAAKKAQVSKPAPLAKPAVAKKPLAKADVTVDDDDDDDENTRKKTNPNKSSTKTTAKKRQDDDDDDDEDDQPQKKNKKNKTKNKGGSGAMIALIGGGVIALAAIVGGGIWMLSRDGKKKEETASSTSDSKPTLSPPSYGGSGGSGPGGPGRPGGPGGKPGGPGMPGGPGGPGMPSGPDSNPMPGGSGVTTPVSADGWQTFTVEGFSAEMPGKPTLAKSETQQTPAGAVAGKTYILENAAKDEGFMVAVASLPLVIEDPVQVQAFFTAALAGIEKETASLSLGGAKIKIGTPSDIKQDGFPGKEVQLLETDGGMGGGVIRIVLARNKCYVFGTGSPKITNFQEQTKRFMGSVKISATSGDGGNVAIGGPNGGGPGRPPMGGSAGGPPMGGPSGGMQYPMNGSGGGPPNRPPGGGPGGVSPPGAAYGQQGAGGPMQPGGVGGPMQPGGIGGQPGIGGPMQPGGFGGQPGGFSGQPGGLGGPGGGFGGQPGGLGGPGMPGRPGGGGPGRPGMGGPGQVHSPTDVNPAPFGVNADGRLKHKIDTFYTAAFLEQKEQKAFFTITSRQEKTKLLGTLTWHEYPSFTPKGSYKLPHLATRAVIDSDKGLLYVTTTSNLPAATINPLQYDLVSLIGDIHVFELSSIIDGTIPPGAELKPLATIPIGKSIHGLELSNDGKFLFVASTTTSKTSSVLKIDTETRKATGTPLALPEPVWEMRKTADGKSLLILDAAPHVLGKTAMIRVYNQETLKEDKQPISAQGVANHIASAPSAAKGDSAVTVAGSGANLPGKLYVIGNSGPQEMQLGLGWKAAANGNTAGFVEYSPDGKLLFVTAYRAPGLDVYEVGNDSTSSLTTLKKKASIRTAGGPTQYVGGHFYISPDGLYLVDHHGIVLETANIGGSNGEGANAGAFGQPGRPGGPGVGPGGPGVGPGGPGLVPGGPGMGPGGPGAAPGGPGLTPLTPGMTPGGAPGMVPGGTPGTGGPGAPGGPGKPPGPGGPGKPPAPGGGPTPPAPGGSPMPPAPGGNPMPPAPGAPNPDK